MFWGVFVVGLPIFVWANKLEGLRVLNSSIIPPLDYRAAMRKFPAAVHVATTNGPAGKRGITVSAATSVSDKPAILLVCVNRDHEQNALFQKNGCFALNTLSSDQTSLSRAFADGKLTSEQRFEVGTWNTLVTGAPCLDQAVVVFDCEIIDIAEMATHSVLFGQVKAIKLEETKNALLYANRQYFELGQAIE